MNVYLDLYLTFAKVGMFTIGGGYAMLPLLQREVVDKKKWSSEEDIIDYFAIGQCTPGIIAINTSTFIGYYKKGITGAICATLGFVTPSIIIVTLIASLIQNYASSTIVQHALAGIRIAVCLLLVQAIIKLFKNGIKDLFHIALFIVMFLLSYFKILSSIFVIILTAIISIIYKKWIVKE